MFFLNQAFRTRALRIFQFVGELTLQKLQKICPNTSDHFAKESGVFYIVSFQV